MAARFWVGGTGTWDSSDTSHWASTTGGASGASVPGASDDATFDGSSGGGTVTVVFGGAITLNTLEMGAFTGTLDFSVNNNSISMRSLNCSGSGARTLKMGSGTWTMDDTGAALMNFSTATNLTLDVGTCTVLFRSRGDANAAKSIAWPLNSVVNGGAGVVWPNVTVDGNASSTRKHGTLNFNNTNATLTIANLTISGPCPTITNVTASGAISVSGVATIGGSSSTTAVGFAPMVSQAMTLPNGTALNYCSLQGMVFTGTGITATNSFDLGANTGITISSPAGGGGGGVIGN